MSHPVDQEEKGVLPNLSIRFSPNGYSSTLDRLGSPSPNTLCTISEFIKSRARYLVALAAFGLTALLLHAMYTGSLGLLPRADSVLPLVPPLSAPSAPGANPWYNESYADLPDPDPSANRRILLLQHFNRYSARAVAPTPDELADASRISHERYAAAHGYGYKPDEGHYMDDPDLPPLSEAEVAAGMYRSNPHMNKLSVILHAVLEELAKGPEGAEWISQSDADTLITTPQIPLHLFLPPASISPPPLILGAQDFIGFNSGAVLWRVCPRLVSFLGEVLALEHEVYEDTGRTLADQTTLGWAIMRHADVARRFWEVPQEWLDWFHDEGRPVEELAELRAQGRPSVQCHMPAWRKTTTRWRELFRQAQGWHDEAESGEVRWRYPIERLEDLRWVEDAAKRYWDTHTGGIDDVFFPDI